LCHGTKEAGGESRGAFGIDGSARKTSADRAEDTASFFSQLPKRALTEFATCRIAERARAAWIVLCSSDPADCLGR